MSNELFSTIFTPSSRRTINIRQRLMLNTIIGNVWQRHFWWHYSWNLTRHLLFWWYSELNIPSLELHVNPWKHEIPSEVQRGRLIYKHLRNRQQGHNTGRQTGWKHVQVSVIPTRAWQQPFWGLFIKCWSFQSQRWWCCRWKMTRTNPFNEKVANTETVEKRLMEKEREVKLY